MGYLGRALIAIFGTFGCAAAGIIYYRIGVDVLFPMALETYKGPFSPAVDALKGLVPVMLGIIMLGLWVWVIVGAVRTETAANQQRVVR